MNSYLLETFKAKFPDDVLDTHAFRGDETVLLKKELGFDFLMDLSAADYLPREPRFELVCHFYSTKNNYRLRLKCPVAENDARVDSLTTLWAGANWFEREAYDMYGIKFEGHPDLRRILMYDGFEGHPLRKDYPLKKRQPRIPHRE